VVRVAAERLAGWVERFEARHGPASSAGTSSEVTLSAPDGARAVIEVPFPPLPSAAGPQALVEHALVDRTVGAVLVRRGGYAVGWFTGRRLVGSKVGTAYVQGRTKAGGWSQQRYARRRANQASAAFADAADTAVRVLHGHRLDALAAGGDRDAVRAVLADRRLAGLEPTGPWLQVKDPKLRVLQTMPEQFRAVRIRLDP